MSRTVLFAVLAPACFGPSLTEQEACDLASAYVSSNEIWVTGSELVNGPSAEGCSDFWTVEDDNQAGISVDVGYAPSDGSAMFAGATVDCYLMEADQGWRVQECIPRI